jgi:hypothetical protein
MASQPQPHHHHRCAIRIPSKWHQSRKRRISFFMEQCSERFLTEVLGNAIPTKRAIAIGPRMFLYNFSSTEATGSRGLQSKSFLFPELLKLCESMYEICVCRGPTPNTPPVASSTSNSLADQFCEQHAASGRHQFSKSNLSRMDINLNLISQGDGSEQCMPKT